MENSEKKIGDRIASGFMCGVSGMFLSMPLGMLKDERWIGVPLALISLGLMVMALWLVFSGIYYFFRMQE